MSRISSEIHHKMLNAVQKAVVEDQRFIGLLAGGSLLHGGFDDFSDLDLVIVVSDSDYESVMGERREFAAAIGDLLAAFTGEHVGEPRLLICLFDDPPVHVDLKFVTPNALDHLVEKPVILWARTPYLAQRIENATIAWPNRSIDWFEERFWIWVHYAATKIGRGELYEAMGMIAFLREQVLGPLIHQQAGRPQRGVRRLEMQGSDWSDRLRATIADHNRASVVNALNAAIKMYRELRGDYTPAPSRAETAVASYVQQVCENVGDY